MPLAAAWQFSGLTVVSERRFGVDIAQLESDGGFTSTLIISFGIVSSGAVSTVVRDAYRRLLPASHLRMFHVKRRDHRLSRYC